MLHAASISTIQPGMRAAVFCIDTCATALPYKTLCDTIAAWSANAHARNMRVAGLCVARIWHVCDTRAGTLRCHSLTWWAG